MLVKTDDLPHEVRYTKTDAVISAVGATLLIVSEMLGAIVAFAWAIGSMLGLGETPILIFIGVMSVPGLILSATLTRRILRVEHSLRDSGSF
jgi:membrane protein implicated in regulation of membrane protease activity